MLAWHILIEMIGKMIGVVMVGAGEILVIGETEADEVLREATGQCTQQYAISVVEIAKYLLGLMVVNQFIALTALKHKVEIKNEIILEEAGNLMIEIVVVAKTKVKIMKS